MNVEVVNLRTPPQASEPASYSLRRDKAARYIDVSPAKLDEFAKAGLIRPRKERGVTLYLVSELQELVREKL